METAIQNATMPSPAALVIPGSPDFFSMIPRQVYQLRYAKKIKTRDVEVLGLLLQFKPKGGTVIETYQQTLADSLGCSVDTIQRSLKRLCAEGIALIVKITRRGCKGEFDHNHYDLAPTLDLTPAHAAKKRKREERTGGDPHQASTTAAGGGRSAHRRPRTSGPGAGAVRDSAESSKPQECGSKAESGIVGEANNSDTPPESAPLPPSDFSPPSDVVLAFSRFSVGSETARDWETKLGAPQCLKATEAVAAKKRRGGLQDAGGYLIGVLRKLADAAKSKDAVNSAAAAKTAAKAAGAVTPKKPAAPPAPDALASLPAESRAALEHCARAELAAESPALRKGYESGRHPGPVQGRMRKLLAQGWEHVESISVPDAAEPVPDHEAIAAAMAPVPAAPVTSDDLHREWDLLGDEERRPYRAVARTEMTARFETAGFAGKTPPPEAVENRARTLYIQERRP